MMLKSYTVNLLTNKDEEVILPKEEEDKIIGNKFRF